MDLLLFTKHLKTVGGLDLDEAAARAAEWGFDGFDLTVREGGYVDPDAVETELPAAVDLCAEHGLPVPMITTRITEVDDRARRVFEAADEAGVDVLKLGYWPYDGLGTLDACASAMATDLAALDSLSADHDVTPAVHVHAGGMVSASGVLLADLLAECEEVAAYPDLGHLSVEGGEVGWRIALERLAPHTVVVGCKAYGWTREEDGWKRYPVPLGEGLVDWPAALSHLADAGFSGPLSLHAEYDAPFEELCERIEADRAFLAGTLDGEVAG
jgi:sugar phosphate isomerase/epimerase